MNEIKRKTERAALAGLSANSMPVSERSTEVSMDELAALVETAGGTVVGMALQMKVHPTLGEYQNVVPSTHNRKLTTA